MLYITFIFAEKEKTEKNNTGVVIKERCILKIMMYGEILKIERVSKK